MIYIDLPIQNAKISQVGSKIQTRQIDASRVPIQCLQGFLLLAAGKQLSYQDLPKLGFRGSQLGKPSLGKSPRFSWEDHLWTEQFDYHCHVWLSEDIRGYISWLFLSETVPLSSRPGKTVTMVSSSMSIKLYMLYYHVKLTCLVPHRVFRGLRTTIDPNSSLRSLRSQMYIGCNPLKTSLKYSMKSHAIPFSWISQKKNIWSRIFDTKNLSKYFTKCVGPAP